MPCPISNGSATPLTRLSSTRIKLLLSNDTATPLTRLSSFSRMTVPLLQHGSLAHPQRLGQLCDAIATSGTPRLRALFPNGRPATVLLTGSVPAKARRETADAILSGQPVIAVGTHALANTAFRKLALAVVDEQHKFGVEQRKALLRANVHSPEGWEGDANALSADEVPRSIPGGGSTAEGGSTPVSVCLFPPAHSSLVSRLPPSVCQSVWD